MRRESQFNIVYSAEICPTKPHHIHPISLEIRLPHDVHRKINRAHDAVAERFVNKFLDRCAVGADDFALAVEQWIGGNRRGKRKTQDKNYGSGLVLQHSRHTLDFVPAVDWQLAGVLTQEN